MIPVGDTEVRGSGPGILTIALIVINVIVFLFEAMMSTPELENFFRTYGVVPAQIMQGSGLITLFTHMFLHGGWMHLISNMVFLWVFGDNIEAVLGKVMYLAFYIAGGLAAAALQILIDPASTIPSVGASGAIAAILGAYIVMFPRSQVKVMVMSRVGMGMTRVTALVFLGIWFVTQLFSGVASLGVPTAQTGGIAFWAHIGGFLFGLVVGFLFRGRAGRLPLTESA
ncbi:MAG: rhomboid family intramembrane serine protease [Anaerolineales bacterium]|nr:rhomboid family intramembrane serine protease [Anaerolineales bacterium]